MDFIKRTLERYREHKREKKSKKRFASYKKHWLESYAIGRPKQRGDYKYYAEELREVARRTKNEQGNVQLLS